MVSIETRDGSDTTNVVAKVKARSYIANSISDLAQYDVSFPSDDTFHSTPVNSADFIDADGDFEVRLRYVAPATFTPLGFTVGLDQVRVMVE